MRGFVSQDNNNSEKLLVLEPQLQSVNANDVHEGLDVHDVGLNDIRLLRAQQQLLLVQMQEQKQLHQLHLQQQLQHYSQRPQADRLVMKVVRVFMRVIIMLLLKLII
jgi:hypothetical protein